MNIVGLRFTEDTDWDNSHESLQFYAYIGSERIICKISQIALNDYYETEDTSAQALKNYQKNKQYIHVVATRHIQEDNFKAENEILITRNDLK